MGKLRPGQSSVPHGLMPRRPQPYGATSTEHFDLNRAAAPGGNPEALRGTPHRWGLARSSKVPNRLLQSEERGMERELLVRDAG